MSSDNERNSHVVIQYIAYRRTIHLNPKINVYRERRRGVLRDEDDKSEEILKENEKTTTGDNEVLASKKLASIQNSCKYGGSLLSEITYIN